MSKNVILGLILALSFTFISCRGGIKTEAPIHPWPNMDEQSKYKNQDFSLHPPEDVVAWGAVSGETENPSGREDFLRANSAIYTGKVNGSEVTTIPLAVNEELINRGQERYNIYCSVCHNFNGDGKSRIVERGVGLPPITLLGPTTKRLNDGELFTLITEGRGLMPPYAKQLSEKDRWAIVSYIRALQARQFKSVNQLPAKLKEEFEQ